MVNDHYEQSIQLLSMGKALDDFTTSQKKKLVVYATYFQLIVGQLYKTGPDEILCRYVLPHEQERILVEAHDGVARGNYGGRATTRKILRVGLWWPTLHSDATNYANSCVVCQRIGKPSRRDEFPLVP